MTQSNTTRVEKMSLETERVAPPSESWPRMVAAVFAFVV